MKEADNPNDEPDEDTERDFNLHFNSLMRRLLKAGLITHYEESPDESDNIQIDWNPDYKQMGGEAAFMGLSILLADICPEAPLSTDEQMIIQLLRQEYWGEGNSD